MSKSLCVINTKNYIYVSIQIISRCSYCLNDSSRSLCYLSLCLASITGTYILKFSPFIIKKNHQETFFLLTIQQYYCWSWCKPTSDNNNSLLWTNITLCFPFTEKKNPNKNFSFWLMWCEIFNCLNWGFTLPSPLSAPAAEGEKHWV